MILRFSLENASSSRDLLIAASCRRLMLAELTPTTFESAVVEAPRRRAARISDSFARTTVEVFVAPQNSSLGTWQMSSTIENSSSASKYSGFV